MGSEHYCLRWNNHQNNLLGVFSQLLQDESLVDVTLACSEGHSIRAHKVVLSACSSYFQSLFIDHPNRHPIVILKDVCFAELRTLVEFMYRGEVNVEYCQLSTLLKTAESLKVKGLAEMTHLSTSPSSEGQRDSMNGTLSEPPPQPSSSLPPPSSPLAKQTMSTDPVNPESISIKKLASEDSSPPPVDTHCGDRSPSPDADDVSSVQSGPSDMTLGSRLPSPHSSEPMPGPSGLPPVQQVPLVSHRSFFFFKYFSHFYKNHDSSCLNDLRQFIGTSYHIQSDIHPLKSMVNPENPLIPSHFSKVCSSFYFYS